MGIESGSLNAVLYGELIYDLKVGLLHTCYLPPTCQLLPTTPIEESL